MSLPRVPLFRIVRLLLPALAALVMQTAMLVTMSQARIALPQAHSQSQDHMHGGHHASSKASLQQEMPCHEKADAGNTGHPLCLALCCLALPLQPELYAMPQAAELPGIVRLPVLSGVQTMPPSPPPRG